MGHRRLPVRTAPLKRIGLRLALPLAALALLATGGCAMRCYKPYDLATGESLSSVCSRFGLSESEIRKYNLFEPGFEPREHDRIYIPCEAEPGRTPSKARIPDPDAPKTAKAEKPKPTATPSPKRMPTAVSEPAVKEENVRPPSAKFSRVTFVWPVEGEVVRSFKQGGDAPVNGIDIRAASGAPVLAAAAGKVEYVGVPASAYGPMVLLNHEGGFYTVYSHLGALAVESGRSVEKGQKIALAGDDNYVHFELREGRASVDPLLYLPKR